MKNRVALVAAAATSLLLTAVLTPGPQRFSLPRPWRRQRGAEISAVPL